MKRGGSGWNKGWLFFCKPPPRNRPILLAKASWGGKSGCFFYS